MKRILDILKLTIISPETLFLLLMYFFWKNDYSFLTLLGEKIRSNEEVWKYVPVLPFLFSGATFKFSSKLRAPLENSSNKELYEWPGYQKVVDRVIASIIICILCCAVSLVIWIFSNEIPQAMLGMLFLSSVVISGISTLLVYLASHKIREILERYGCSNK